MTRLSGLLVGATLLVVLFGGYMSGKRAGRAAAEEELTAGGGSGAAPGLGQDAGRERRIVSAIGKSLNAPSNPRARVAELGQSGDPVERLEGVLALAASLRADEFKETVESFIEVGTWNEQKTELGILLQTWAAVDLAAAVEFISETTLPEDVRASVLLAWAKSSPDEAVAYARENHRHNPRNPANPMLMAVINGLAHTDLERATALIGELPEGKAREDALRSTVLAAMENNIDSAIRWSDGIVDDKMNADAVKLILRNVAAHDPERAAELMLEMGGDAGNAADRIALAFAKSDVERAMGWTRELEGDHRANAARGVVMALCRDDPHRAVEYIESMRGTTDLGAAVVAFAWGASLVEPALASDWIGEVADTAKQRRMYHHILARWLHDDREAASEWIESNTLPEGVLEGIGYQRDPGRPDDPGFGES